MKSKIILLFVVLFVIPLGVIWICLEWLPRREPLFAWQHGTPEMQRKAAGGVMRLHPPGTSIYTVVENVGPGSLEWPYDGWPYDAGALKSGQISFNADGTFVFGITFYYEDGKVIRSEIFD